MVRDMLDVRVQVPRSPKPAKGVGGTASQSRKSSRKITEADFHAGKVYEGEG